MLFRHHATPNVKAPRPVLDIGHAINVGLVGCWLLGDANVGLTRDISPFNRVSVPKNSPGFMAGSHGGQTLNFVHASQHYVLAAPSKILSGLSNYSISAWIKWDGASGGAIYCERGSSGNDIVKMEMNTGGSVVFTVRNDAGTLNQPSGGTGGSTAWEHLVITVAGSSVVIYHNGHSISTGTASTGSFTDATIQTWIGGDQQDSSAYVNFPIENVRAYSRTLNGGDVWELFSRPYVGINTSTGHSWAKAAAGGTAALVALASAMAFGKGAAGAKVAISARAAANGNTKGILSVAAMVTARIAAGAKGRSAASASVAILVRSGAAASGKSSLSAALALAARSLSAAKSGFSTPALKVAVQALSKAMATAMGVISGPGSLVARSFSMLRAAAAPSATTSVSAKATAQTKALPQVSAGAAISARAGSQAKTKANPGLVASILARATGQAKTAAQASAAAAISARASSQGKARSNPGFAISLAAQTAAAAKGSASAIYRVGLGANSKAASFGRGAFSVAAAGIALVATSFSRSSAKAGVSAAAAIAARSVSALWGLFHLAPPPLVFDPDGAIVLDDGIDTLIIDDSIDVIIDGDQ